MKKFLKKVSSTFKKEGYQFFVGGPESFLIYLGYEKFKEFKIFSNCDLVFLAENFESVKYSEDGYSSVLEISGIKLKFIIEPEMDLKVPGNLKKMLNSYNLNLECFFYIPFEDKFFDPFAVFNKTLKKRKLSFMNDGSVKLKNFLKSIYFASEYGFELEENVLIENGKISNIDIEYFLKILTSKNPFYGLLVLDRVHILEKIIPEIKDLKGCPQDKEFHPEGDVFAHTMQCFKNFRTDNRMLAISLLLHDIGKPYTITYSPSLRFPFHAEVGAKIAKKISRKLGFTKTESEEVSFYIRNHLLGAIIRNTSYEHLKEIIDSPNFENLLKLYKADILGSVGNLREYKKALKYFKNLKKESMFF